VGKEDGLINFKRDFETDDNIEAKPKSDQKKKTFFITLWLKWVLFNSVHNVSYLNMDWKNLKQWMGEKELDVKFIKLDQNTKTGHVRLGNNLASEAVSKLNGQTYEEKILEVSEIPENEQKMIMEKLKPDKGKKRGRGKDKFRKGGKRRRFN